MTTRDSGIRRWIGSRGRLRAFSLTEMMVSVLIVAILSSLSIVSYKSFRHKRLKREAGKRIISTFHIAREHAIAENRVYQAVINLDDATVWVDRGTSVSPTYKPKIISPVRLPEFVEVTGVQVGGNQWLSGWAPVAFRPDGTATTAFVHLKETLSPPTTATVRLFGSTGVARIYEGN